MAYLDLNGTAKVMEELWEIAKKADPERVKLLELAINTCDISVLDEK